MSSIIQNGDVVPILVFVLDQSSFPLAGKDNIKIKIWRISDNAFLDWSDMTFKNYFIVTTLWKRLDAVTGSPGNYKTLLDTSLITNLSDNETLEIDADQLADFDAANLPQTGELLIGAYPKELLDRGAQPYQSYVYNPSTDVLEGVIWLEWKNTVQLPSTVSVDWYHANGSLMFTMTSISPDAQGIFRVTKLNPGLLGNNLYYAIPSITLPGLGVVRGVKAPFTVA